MWGGMPLVYHSSDIDFSLKKWYFIYLMRIIESAAGRFLGRAKKIVEGLTQPDTLSGQELYQRTTNFYDHANLLLRACGATDEVFFTNYEDRAFFTERFAAHFFDGLFPTDLRNPVNGKTNRINHQLRQYIRTKLPVPLTRQPDSTDADFEREQAIDQIAHICLMIFTEIGPNYEKGNIDYLSKYVIGSLEGKTIALFWTPPVWVTHSVHKVLGELRTSLADSTA